MRSSNIEEIKINVFEVIGGTAAVATEDGNNLYLRICKALDKKIYVTLDFMNIELVTSTFLNTAIGQLYSSYSSNILKEYLKVKNMANEDLVLLKKVVERAKDYFKDPDSMKKTIKTVLDSEK